MWTSTSASQTEPHHTPEQRRRMRLLSRPLSYCRYFRFIPRYRVAPLQVYNRLNNPRSVDLSGMTDQERGNLP